VLRIRLAADLGVIDLPFQQSLDRIREMQLNAVEIDLLRLMSLEDFTRTAVREIRKNLSDRNLLLAGARFRTRRGFDDPTGLEKRLEQTQKSMELTCQLGGNVTIIRLGHVPKEKTSPDWQIMREVIGELCRFGERAGTVVAAEAERSPPEDFLKLLDGIPQGGFGVDINPGELAVHGFEPVSTIQTLGSRIVTFHATDATSRPGGYGYEIVPLGRGDLDYPAILSALEGTEFTGCIVLRPCGDQDPLGEIRRAKEFIYGI